MPNQTPLQHHPHPDLQLPEALSSFLPPKTTESLADALVDPAKFCRLRFSPLLATGVVIGILREHFARPQNIDDPMLQRYVQI